MPLCLQVETVGDKYMAVSGLPEPCNAHARCIARLALDMMDLSSEVKVDGKPVVSRHSRDTSRLNLHCKYELGVRQPLGSYVVS